MRLLIPARYRFDSFDYSVQFRSVDYSFPLDSNSVRLLNSRPFGPLRQIDSGLSTSTTLSRSVRSGSGDCPFPPTSGPFDYSFLLVPEPFDYSTSTPVDSSRTTSPYVPCRLVRLFFACHFCSGDVSGPSGALPTTLYRSRLIRLIMSSPVCLTRRCVSHPFSSVRRIYPYRFTSFRLLVAMRFHCSSVPTTRRVPSSLPFFPTTRFQTMRAF